MREPAQAFLEDTKSRPGTREASIAHRLIGSTRWLQGDFIGARLHLENSLAIYNTERDRDFAFRFGQDSGVSAMIVLALTLWPLGKSSGPPNTLTKRPRKTLGARMSRLRLLLTVLSRFLR